MPRVLVTGMSGTGKSTALGVLRSRGHRTVDTDTDQWSHWVVTLPDESTTGSGGKKPSPNCSRGTVTVTAAKRPGERDLILHHLANIEPPLRATATVEIDASAPVAEVVRQLEELG
jgi:hypothetical protein